MSKPRKGFTLVELLVVIGIIALLISILLPALNKARDSANTVACESNMRQVYNFMVLYSGDFQGVTMPCVMQVPSREYDWYTNQLVGYEYGRTVQNVMSGTSFNIFQGQINTTLLRCPSANHDLDPAADQYAGQAFNAYYGDYVYNQNLGTLKTTTGTPSGYYYAIPYVKMSRTPGNVIALTDSYKPNYDANAKAATTGYKCYFSKETDLLKTAVPIRQGTPHVKVTKANYLFMDGHIATINPFKEFYDASGTFQFDYMIGPPPPPPVQGTAFTQANLDAWVTKWDAKRNNPF